MKIILAACLLAILPSVAISNPLPRSQKERAAFVKTHPCPNTGKTTGSCLGYVVDHAWPICARGPDKVANMRWSTVAESRVKDTEERALCNQIKRNRFPIFKDKIGLCLGLAKSPPQWPLLTTAICKSI